MCSTNAVMSPRRSSHRKRVRGKIGTRIWRRNSAYVSNSAGPRYILTLPTMWANTKPMIMMPVMAITYFLPTADR